MKKVVVGSSNPVKLESVKEAFMLAFKHEEFEFLSCEAMSGVSDQPVGSEETKRGAQNRVRNCMTAVPEVDYYVGIEGGIEPDGDDYWVFGWMCVVDRDGRVGLGKTGAFLLPPRVSQLINEGNELGHATDMVFNDTDSKRRLATIGLLTDGVLTRKDYYVQALIFALIPFLKSDLY